MHVVRGVAGELRRLDYWIDPMDTLDLSEEPFLPVSFNRLRDCSITLSEKLHSTSLAAKGDAFVALMQHMSAPNLQNLRLEMETPFHHPLLAVIAAIERQAFPTLQAISGSQKIGYMESSWDEPVWKAIRRKFVHLCARDDIAVRNVE